MPRAPLGLLAAFALGLGLLLWWVASPRITDTPAVATPTVSPAAAAPSTTAAAIASPTVVRHRLAGTVVGDVLYAVIEQPDGSSDLYRPGDDVAGLGRLVEVGPNRATFDGPNGHVELILIPAPTATRAPATPVTPRVTPERSPARAPSAPESSP